MSPFTGRTFQIPFIKALKIKQLVGSNLSKE